MSTATWKPAGAGWYRRHLLTKAQREQQARWLEVLRQPEPQAAPDEREHANKETAS